jgi:aminopeptidase N
MKRFFLSGFLFALTLSTVAQNQPQQVQPTEYRATSEKINNLVHTKLDARLDFPKSQLHGKAWITLKPHFYPTDSLLLDAKGMDIKEVSIVKNGKNQKLKYSYDNMLLDIDLDKTYKNNEQYTVYISYTAKPNEYTGKGSAAITDAKGLYFIDPLDEIEGKPTQVWTQGNRSNIGLGTYH